MRDSRNLFSTGPLGAEDCDNCPPPVQNATSHPANSATTVQTSGAAPAAPLGYSGIRTVQSNPTQYENGRQLNYIPLQGHHALPYKRSSMQQSEPQTSDNTQRVQHSQDAEDQKPGSFPSRQRSSQDQRMIITRNLPHNLDNGDQRPGSSFSIQDRRQISYAHFDQPSHSLHTAEAPQDVHRDRQRPVAIFPGNQSSQESSVDFGQPHRPLKMPRYNDNTKPAASLSHATSLPPSHNPDLIIDQNPRQGTWGIDVLASVCADAKYEQLVPSHEPVNAADAGDVQHMANSDSNGEEEQSTPDEEEEGDDEGPFMIPQYRNRQASHEVSDSSNSEKTFKHKCYHCGKQSVLKPALLKEISRYADKVYLFRCDICGKGFKTKGWWKKHLRSHRETAGRDDDGTQNA